MNPRPSPSFLPARQISNTVDDELRRKGVHAEAARDSADSFISQMRRKGQKQKEAQSRRLQKKLLRASSSAPSGLLASPGLTSGPGSVGDRSMAALNEEKQQRSRRKRK